MSVKIKNMSGGRPGKKKRWKNHPHAPGPAIDGNAPEVLAASDGAETMREALVLSVRLFGVTAAQVYEAENQCCGRAELVAVLAAVLTGAQKQDERVRPALEVWWRQQRELLSGRLVLTSDQRLLPEVVEQRQYREFFQANGHVSYGATNATGAPPAGRLDAKATTTRQAVLLSLRALGTNCNAVTRADKRRSELDQLIAVLATMLNDSQKGHSLVLAAEDGKRTAVSWLLGVGVDPNSVGDNSVGSVGLGEGVISTPLVATIRGGHYDIFDKLLDTGADCEKEDPHGMRPLMWATAFGRVAYCLRLVAEGADASVNAQDADGHSALHYAADGKWSFGDTEVRAHRAVLIVVLLLEMGADKALVDNAGKTACHYAETRGHTRAMKMLRDLPLD